MLEKIVGWRNQGFLAFVKTFKEVISGDDSEWLAFGDAAFDVEVICHDGSGSLIGQSVRKCVLVLA